MTSWRILGLRQLEGLLLRHSQYIKSLINFVKVGLKSILMCFTPISRHCWSSSAYEAPIRIVFMTLRLCGLKSSSGKTYPIDFLSIATTKPGKRSKALPVKSPPG